MTWELWCVTRIVTLPNTSMLLRTVGSTPHQPGVLRVGGNVIVRHPSAGSMVALCHGSVVRLTGTAIDRPAVTRVFLTGCMLGRVVLTAGCVHVTTRNIALILLTVVQGCKWICPLVRWWL